MRLAVSKLWNRSSALDQGQLALANTILIASLRQMAQKITEELGVGELTDEQRKLVDQLVEHAGEVAYREITESLFPEKAAYEARTKIK